MIELVTRPRRSRLRDLLEALDFNMDAAPHAASRHQLVRVDRLRLFSWFETDPDANGIRHGPEPVEGETHLAWAGEEIQELDAVSSKDCFWALISTVDANPQEIRDFVESWGLLAESGSVHKSGVYEIDDFRAEATLVRDILLVLVATEAGELVSEACLENVGNQSYTDLYRMDDREAVLERLNLPADFDGDLPDYLVFPVLSDLRRERWRTLRDKGQGVPIQASIIVDLLNTYVGVRDGAFIWDSGGRRVERIARGVKAIAWSYLATLFSSAALDIYPCSVCGKPFEFIAEAARRRPRQGMSRFCSSECRLQAKRQSNRLSWQRNSARWRPRKGARNKHESQG